MLWKINVHRRLSWVCRLAILARCAIDGLRELRVTILNRTIWALYRCDSPVAFNSGNRLSVSLERRLLSAFTRTFVGPAAEEKEGSVLSASSRRAADSAEDRY